MNETESVLVNKGSNIIGRILPGTDLLEGIKQMCNKYNVQYGVICTVLGSITQGCIVCVQSDEENPMAIRYSDPVIIEGPLEILSCQGIIGRDIDNEFQIHLHGLLVDSNLKVIGGHFISGNKILATAEVMIKSVQDAKFIRKYDKKIGFPLFHFIQN